MAWHVPAGGKAITGLFHRMWYHQKQRTWWSEDTTWLGTRVMKSPFDLWIYQEILARVRPDLIIETGTNFGGGAFYLASICDLLDHGRVLTVDIRNRPDLPQHPRITYIEGSSTAPEVVERIRAHAADTTMVILDSSHKCDHVLQELDCYGPMVSPRSYMVVEDTHLNGHPVSPRFGPGPMEALEKWLPAHPEFRVDTQCEKFFMTWHPRGYLQRRVDLAAQGQEA